MKKVLFVVDEKRLGGVSILLNDILNKININKYKIDILVLHNSGDYLNNLPSSINIIYGNSFFDSVDLTLKEVLKRKNIKLIFNKLRLIFLMKTSLIKKRLVKERKKILHDNYDVEIAFKDGFCAIFTGVGETKKKYHWLHTDYEMYDCTSNYHNLFVDIFSRFDKIIAISNSVLDHFKKIYPVNNTEVIYNIIDKDKIIKMSCENNVKYDNNKINFITVGRFHYMKGFDRLVEVFNKLNNDNLLNDVTLRIIGCGTDYDMVSNMIKEYHLNDKVILLGEQKNPYKYVKKSDMFIMCSRYEPFGLVILESLILKVPVLSLEEASIHEIMNNDKLIYPNTFEGLYDGIKYIIEHKEEIKTYKKELDNYDYDIKKIIKQIEDLLDE